MKIEMKLIIIIVGVNLAIYLMLGFFQSKKAYKNITLTNKASLAEAVEAQKQYKKDHLEKEKQEISPENKLTKKSTGLWDIIIGGVLVNISILSALFDMRGLYALIGLIPLVFLMQYEDSECMPPKKVTMHLNDEISDEHLAWKKEVLNNCGNEHFKDKDVLIIISSMCKIAGKSETNCACDNVFRMLQNSRDISAEIKTEIYKNYNEKISGNYKIDETLYLQYLLHFSPETQTMFKKFGPVIYTYINDTDLNERVYVYSDEKKSSRFNKNLDQDKLNLWHNQSLNQGGINKLTLSELNKLNIMVITYVESKYTYRFLDIHKNDSTKLWEARERLIHLLSLSPKKVEANFQKEILEPFLNKRKETEVVSSASEKYEEMAERRSVVVEGTTTTTSSEISIDEESWRRTVQLSFDNLKIKDKEIVKVINLMSQVSSKKNIDHACENVFKMLMLSKDIGNEAKAVIKNHYNDKIKNEYEIDGNRYLTFLLAFSPETQKQFKQNGIHMYTYIDDEELKQRLTYYSKKKIYNKFDVEKDALLIRLNLIKKIDNTPGITNFPEFAPRYEQFSIEDFNKVNSMLIAHLEKTKGLSFTELQKKNKNEIWLAKEQFEFLLSLCNQDLRENFDKVIEPLLTERKDTRSFTNTPTITSTTSSLHSTNNFAYATPNNYAMVPLVPSQSSYNNMPEPMYELHATDVPSKPINYVSHDTRYNNIDSYQKISLEKSKRIIEFNKRVLGERRLKSEEFKSTLNKARVMKNQNYYYHLKHFQDQDIKRATQRVNHPENNRENIEKLHKMHMAVANKYRRII